MSTATQFEFGNAPSPAPARIPPLQNGDRLTREEFERRYNAMPNLKGAELIEGIVFMPSPVRYQHHSQPQFHILIWLGNYVSKTSGVRGGGSGSIRLNASNEPQPDGFLMIDRACGGQATIDADDYVSGAPELVVEVSSSTVSYDLHEKMNVYCRNGVKEYIVWRVEEEAIDWFILKEGCYKPLATTDDVLRSITFPGLWLDVVALLRGDLPKVSESLDRGMATGEYREFEEKLAQSLKD